MGISKKKFSKGIKTTSEELAVAVEQIHNHADQKDKQAKLANQNLFTENTGKVGLKEKREKLKADRFKEQQDFKKSKTDELLIKRAMTAQMRRE
jgi:hypothetical protein